MARNPSTAENSRKSRETPLGRLFDHLGVAVTKHSWAVVVAWVIVVAVAFPAMHSVGSVITNGYTSAIPGSYPSAVAANELSAEFPNRTATATTALVLLETPAITGDVGRNVTLAISHELSIDSKVRDVLTISTLYTAYAEYLTSQAELGLHFLEPAVLGSPSLVRSVNQTAGTLWGPEELFRENWIASVNDGPSNASPQGADWPAYRATLNELASNPTEVEVLDSFYLGNGSASPGFNSTVTPACLDSLNITPCVDASARATLSPKLASLFTGRANQTIAGATLTMMGVENATAWPGVQAVGAAALGTEVGLSPGWLLTLWQAFPSNSPPSIIAIESWAGSISSGASRAPGVLAIPTSLSAEFVSPSDSASLIVISYAHPDTYDINGTSANFVTDSEISRVVSSVISASPQYSGVTYYITGASPLSNTTIDLATSSMGILLLLTIIVLVLIMMVYFRAPLAPAVAFVGIAVALIVSLAAVFAIGKLVISFNPETEPILLIFLLAIGTDYFVFLLARYREELVKGASSDAALRTSVRWAGQSITTSGLTIMVVTSAMTFAPFTNLKEYGWALTFGVLVSLLAALTLVPAVIRLVGPRVFWPYTGARFRTYAARRNASAARNEGYIAKAGSVAVRRPLTVIAIVLLLSAPVVYAAMEVPVSYDMTNFGIPSSQPSQHGMQELSNQFGPGFDSPSYVMVTFSSPIFAGGSPNLSEVREVADLSAEMSSTAGVAGVSSLAGVSGLPWSAWANYSEMRPADQMAARGVLASYVGTDGRTVIFGITTDVGGFSSGAIAVMSQVEQRVVGYESAHPDITSVYYGGAAQETADYSALVASTTEYMLIGAAIGLFVMLLLILGSAFVPALALGTIGLSILWGWAGTYLAVGIAEGEVLLFTLPLILLILVLGLGMDYNVLLLTRVREERSYGGSAGQAVLRAVSHVGGVIAAAALILGCAFLLLGVTSPLGLTAGVGMGIGIAVLIQAFLFQTFLTPAVLALGKDGIWKSPLTRPASKEGREAPPPPAAIVLHEPPMEQ